MWGIQTLKIVANVKVEASKSSMKFLYHLAVFALNLCCFKLRGAIIIIGASVSIVTCCSWSSSFIAVPIVAGTSMTGVSVGASDQDPSVREISALSVVCETNVSLQDLFHFDE